MSRANDPECHDELLYRDASGRSMLSATDHRQRGVPMSKSERIALDTIARTFAEDAPAADYAVTRGCVLAFADDRASLG
jgi:hypothetical protein